MNTDKWYILGFVIGMFAYGMIFLWTLNTLFGLGLEYNFTNFAASIFLVSLIQSKHPVQLPEQNK